MKALVIDTNVLLTDPSCIFKFHEHALFIPTTVLYELDKIKDTKKGDVIREARESIRIINGILGKSSPEEIQKGVKILYPAEMKDYGGTLAIIPSSIHEISKIITDRQLDDSPDAKIIATTLYLQSKFDDVTLVTLDVNMRLIASANGVKHAEAYKNEKALDDVDLLPAGYRTLTATKWGELDCETIYTETEGTTLKLPRSILPEFHLGEYIHFAGQDHTLIGAVKDCDDDFVYLTPKDIGNLTKLKAWGIKPKNKEQAIALDMLLDKDVDLITLIGPAGTGKTLLALAAAIELVVERKTASKIIISRSLANLDEEIGYLPGTEEEKMAPWLAGFSDSLEVMHKEDAKNPAQSYSNIQHTIEKAGIQFKSINFMRGRSLQDCVVILDESQNFTRHQVKTIVSRAGNGCKLVFLGNLNQIDGNLTPLSSGLTHLAKNMSPYKRSRIFQLTENERSPLAEFAESNL